MAPVLLLRAPTEADRYEAALSSAGFTPVSVPVLATTLVNQAELRAAVRAGPGGVDGVIVTSARASEAWAQAASDAGEGDDEAGADWRRTPFYAVGPATAASLASIAAPARLCPHDVRGGAETGTAEQLARFILRDVPAQARLLYLTGDKNRETLPGILDAGGVGLRRVQVYGTQGAAGFGADLARAVAGVPDDEEWWVVYFAPSTAAHVTPLMREWFALAGADGAGRRRARVAAIGRTTAEYLREELGLQVDVVPAKPSAEALVGALEEAG